MELAVHRTYHGGRGRSVRLTTRVCVPFVSGGTHFSVRHWLVPGTGGMRRVLPRSSVTGGGRGESQAPGTSSGRAAWRTEWRPGHT